MSRKRDLLDKFYSVMLMTYEDIVENLKKETDQIIIAGILIGIATVRFENLCISADQGNLSQNADYLSARNRKDVSFENIIKRSSVNVLLGLLQEFVAKQYSGDVHAFNQVKYLFKLTPQPDALPPKDLTFVRVLEWLKKHLETYCFVERFIHNFEDSLPQENLEYILKEYIPSDWDVTRYSDRYLQGFLDLIRRAEQEERDNIATIAKEVTEIVSGKAKEVMDVFKALRCIPYKNLKKLDVTGAVVDAVMQSQSEIIDMKYNIKVDFSSLLAVEIGLEEESLTKEQHIQMRIQKLNVLKLNLFHFTRDIDNAVQQIEFSRKFDEEMDKVGLGGGAIRAQLLRQYLNYLEKMEATFQKIIEEVGSTENDTDEEETNPFAMVFRLDVHGLPSNAIKEARKNEYIRSHFKEAICNLLIAFKVVNIITESSV